MDKTVAFHTLGCRLNMSETGSIAQGFVNRGYKVVEFGVPAEVTFINTCTVTDGADSTCRNLIRKAQKNSPAGKVVVAGCYAQMEAEAIKKMQGVDLILGTNEKFKVFDYLDEDEANQINIDKSNEFWGAATTTVDSHTRAFLKIQDGCNYICSFCIIPFARGRSRAISVQEAIIQTKKLVSEGFKEIILTGVNIGEYESASGEKLVELVKGVVEVQGLKRLRLSSVEPNTITRELLEVLKASGKYQDHFHIPLQSGNDEILKSMRRKYDVAFYKKTIELIKSYFPDASIGADTIVGYPGETDKQFQETFDLLSDLPITHFHVFPYSKRKNTTAVKMENHIQNDVKKQRVKTLINLGEEKLASFAKKMIGSESLVLFEREKDGYFHGYTSHYLKVRLRSDSNLKNEILSLKLSAIEGTNLTGTPQAK
ncbi:MAG: tRNA (N(6)-L-threonylcarbamoyladenosine(37)-C(2))-methylthiotransferase MtaB [Halobacteriovoraceae bacterium]|jgi:threonylcarbamoyladenosine tRNA methylthiotransferase MtaB|nr:tRNA (N(6)-L-threonylcarbamoyladenosine(37)-C(2))-methylthiotransferase MtaB [Halobacteriovoraceae bacterium]